MSLLGDHLDPRGRPQRPPTSITAPPLSAGGAPRPDGTRTYTVLISDLERSTELWERFDRDMEPVVVAHNALLVEAVDANGGWVLSLRGDGILALFLDAAPAIAAAVRIQREISARTFPPVGSLRLRIGITTGRCTLRRGELYGRPPNLAARLEAAGHGGQVLVSDTTAGAAGADLPADVELFELGRYHFRGVSEPVVVHSVLHRDLSTVFPALRVASRGLDELPVEPSPIVGREELIAGVEQLVVDERMVTLCGPGGVGKTRVAVRAASRVRRPFRQGVRYVDLSVVERGDQVATLVLAAFRAQPLTGEDRLSCIVRVASTAQVLLVLDGCEHCLDDVRSLVEVLMAGCPGCHILATSREALDVGRERVVTVPPLQLPPVDRTATEAIIDYASVQLFVERARVTDVDFKLSRDNAAAVAQLVRAVDGLPLALELAAARMDVDSVDRLAADHRVLLSGACGASANDRLQGLSASIEWTYDRLPEEAAAMLRRTSVFAGPFSLDMPATLTGDADGDASRRALDLLARRSLLSRDQITPNRFRLLDTTRTFAESRCGPEEWERLRAAHAALMLDRAEHWGPQLHTESAVRAADVLATDLADHRRAMDWFAASGRTDERARLLVSLFQFGLFHLHADVHDWAADLADVLADKEPLASEVLGAAALAAWYRGDTDRAVVLGLRAVHAAGEHDSTMWARTALVDALGYRGRLNEVIAHFGPLVDERRRSDDTFWQVDGLVFQAISLSMFGRTEEAIAHAERALALSRRLGNPYCMQWSMYGLGRAMAPVDPRAACAAFEESMRATREVGCRFNEGLGMVEWLALRRELGDDAGCVDGAVELMDVLVAGNRSQMSEILREVGFLLARGGSTEDAATALLGRRGLPAMPAGYGELSAPEELIAALRIELGDRFVAIEARALAMTETELIAACRDALLRLSVA